MILFRMGIFEKRFERKPDPRISFSDINLLFLPLHMLHVDFNIYLLFFDMKALTFKSLVSFYISNSTLYIIIYHFLKNYFFQIVIKNCYNYFHFIYLILQTRCKIFHID